MGNENYDNILNTLKEATIVVAERSLSDAANELRGDKETADTLLSVDGTWQKNGFVSSLGVVTAISVDNGKILDVSIMSRACKGCTSMKSLQRSL